MSGYNDPAYPVREFDFQLGVDMQISRGLTIRQQAALIITAGIAANPNCAPSTQEHFDNIATDAIRMADAVLRQEEKTR